MGNWTKLFFLLAPALSLTACEFGQQKAINEFGKGKDSSGTTQRYFTVTSPVVSEGETASFVVSFNQSSSTTMTVDYVTMVGTAGVADFTPTTGTLTFSPGETSKTITVATTDDTEIESQELFKLAFTNGVGFNTSASTSLVAATVNDNDSPGTVHIASATENEGDTLTFAVTLATAVSVPVSVNYATANGTATLADSDYTSASGTLTFAVGETSKTISVTTTGDNKYETSETITVTLSGGSNYVTSGSTLVATGTITNDDTQPMISIADASANEGTDLSFTVSLSNQSYQTVTVNYATADSTATLADSDYTSASGTLTFSPGESSKTITVSTGTDTKYESDEIITATLSGGANYAVPGSDFSGTGTITNEDSQPTVSVNDVSAAEGANLSFTVTLSNLSYQTVTVDYATGDGTATIADSDYTATSGTVSFAPGETNKTVTVATTTDTKFEADETMTASFSGGNNYTVAGSDLSGTGTITNNDTQPTISIADDTENEGTALEFTVTLSNLSYQTVTVNYATANGTATLADSDYTNTSGTLTFNPGESSKTITVNTTSDTKFETDETITVTLSGGGNYTAGGSDLSATGTITNEDSQPTVTVADASEDEGTDLEFDVTLSNLSYQTVTVNYATANGTATLADSDYTNTSGTLTFNPGESSKTITVGTTSDTKYEANETITVTLSGGGNYTAGGSDLSATGTITNDDGVPTISIGSASAAEGSNVSFTVTASHTSSSDITFTYTSSSGSATQGSDFTSTSGTGTITAGNTTTTINVPATEDAVDENDETLTMTLSNPSGATIDTSAGTGTIVDTVLFYDFTTGSLPSNTTFTRASSGSYVNSSGNVTTATSNVARFDHNPASCAGTCTLRGLLMEPAATNLIYRSESFDNAVWTKNALRAVSANDGDATSPDGVNSNAEALLEDATTAEHSARQSIVDAVGAGSLVHFTIYAKPATSARQYFRLQVASGANLILANFDLSGGNSPTTSSGGNGGGQLGASVEDAGNGWKRVRLSGVASTSDTSLEVGIFLQDSFGGATTYAGDNASGINFWGAQLEAGGSVPTSYIATAGATATRAADVLQSSLFSGFSGNFGDGTNWTMITDFSRPNYEHASTSAFPRMVEICEAASCSNNRISMRYNATVAYLGTGSTVGGVSQGTSVTGALSLASHTVYQLGTVKTGTSIQTFYAGAAQTASGALTYPSPDTLYVGSTSVSGAALTGHLRKFTFRARAVPNAQMLTLTSD